MTQVADLSPLPLVPILVSAHGEEGGTNFTHSFASLQCLALLSISCHSAYCHVSGSKADTTQALNQPGASRWWYAAGHAQQTPGLGVN